MPLYTSQIEVQDEGTSQGVARAVNFAGAGVSVAVSGAVATATIAGGAGASWTTVEVDFGSIPTYDKTFTVTDASVSLTSKVIALHAGDAATGRQADENELDALVCRAVPATGSFTLYVRSTTGPVAGKYKVHYTVT